MFCALSLKNHKTAAYVLSDALLINIVSLGKTL